MTLYNAHQRRLVSSNTETAGILVACSVTLTAGYVFLGTGCVSKPLTASLARCRLYIAIFRTLRDGHCNRKNSILDI